MAKFFTYKKKDYKVLIAGYGRYEVVSTYRNIPVSFFTNDSELYDYCDDDSNMRRMYMYQRRCANEIRYVYNHCISHV